MASAAYLNTGTEPVDVSYCTHADHYEAGTEATCPEPAVVTLPSGTALGFDDAADNGPDMRATCEALGLVEVPPEAPHTTT